MLGMSLLLRLLRCLLLALTRHLLVLRLLLRGLLRHPILHYAQTSHGIRVATPRSGFYSRVHVWRIRELRLQWRQPQRIVKRAARPRWSLPRAARIRDGRARGRLHLHHPVT